MLVSQILKHWYIDMKIVTHIKSGRKYLKLSFTITNGTNCNDGQIMVLYLGRYKDKNRIGLFVRELSEFNVKFK